VRSLTLDTWVDQLGIDLQQLAFVKLDAQGSEIHVLRGGRRVLACKHVTWQIEIDPPLLATRGFVPEDLYMTLRRYFTHFIDLSKNATGSRTRSIDEISHALAHVSGGSDGRTDILVFTMESDPRD
jgi:methyltransferase FkbM-like protein